jgi:general secretion pathway protein I
MKSKRSAQQTSLGFTLIEAVVALLIVALGMTAVFIQLNYFATSSVLLQNKTLASWIGSNVVTEMSLGDEWPPLGETENEVEFGQQDWVYTVKVSETDVENLRRVDVAVALAERPDHTIHTVSGLIEPPNNDLPPVSWGVLRQGPRG